MALQKIDFRALKKPTDIALAKEKLKYTLALQEQAITSGFANLGGALIASVRSTAYSMGVKLAYAVVVNFLNRRR
jgi:hypothetical protein